MRHRSEYRPRCVTTPCWLNIKNSKWKSTHQRMSEIPDDVWEATFLKTGQWLKSSILVKTHRDPSQTRPVRDELASPKLPSTDEKGISYHKNLQQINCLPFRWATASKCTFAMIKVWNRPRGSQPRPSSSRTRGWALFGKQTLMALLRSTRRLCSYWWSAGIDAACQRGYANSTHLQSLLATREHVTYMGSQCLALWVNLQLRHIDFQCFVAPFDNITQTKTHLGF